MTSLFLQQFCLLYAHLTFVAFNVNFDDDNVSRDGVQDGSSFHCNFPVSFVSYGQNSSKQMFKAQQGRNFCHNYAELHGKDSVILFIGQV
jgi:hypothetical protein